MKFYSGETSDVCGGIKKKKYLKCFWFNLGSLRTRCRSSCSVGMNMKKEKTDGRFENITSSFLFDYFKTEAAASTSPPLTQLLTWSQQATQRLDQAPPTCLVCRRQQLQLSINRVKATSQRDMKQMVVCLRRRLQQNLQ